MRHPYRIREIAAQAGLSQATVDRVLHRRGGVRPDTARRVHQAIADLDRQQSEPLLIDVVLTASRQCCAAVRAALEDESSIRPRFHLGDAARALDRIGRGRSDGVILLAPAGAETAEALARLSVPVVTLNVDQPAGKRIAHVGVNAFDSGALAAYLVQQWLAERAGDVLLIGDEPDLAAGFRSAIRERAPARRLLTAADGVRAVLAANPSVRAVCSLRPEGNAAVVQAFAAERRNYDVFIGYGLGRENVALLREHRLSAVLHQDLPADLRHACTALLRARGRLSGPIRSRPSAAQVITSYNLPPGEL